MKQNYVCIFICTQWHTTCNAHIYIPMKTAVIRIYRIFFISLRVSIPLCAFVPLAIYLVGLLLYLSLFLFFFLNTFLLFSFFYFHCSSYSCFHSISFSFSLALSLSLFLSYFILFVMNVRVLTIVHMYVNVVYMFLGFLTFASCVFFSFFSFGYCVAHIKCVCVFFFFFLRSIC